MTDMTHADGSGSPQPLFRLIYRSHSTIAPEQRTNELGAIFTTARRNNRGLDVTGALMITDDAFVQALEGDEAQVRDLFQSISGDPRHAEVTVLDEQPVEERIFGRWAMAKVGSDDGPDIRLISNARKGAIVAAPGVDASITPAQQTVLTFMRGSITPDEPAS